MYWYVCVGWLAMIRHTNGRSYKVREGTRGGQYILVGGKRCYLRKQKGGVGTDLDIDDDDDAEARAIFLRDFGMRCKAAQMTPAEHMKNIERFLKTRSDYVVIGGKAAVYHIHAEGVCRGKHKDQDCEDAMTTSDYDVVVTEENFESGGFKAALKAVICGLRVDENKNLGIAMVSMGKHNGIIDSLIDIHLVDDKTYARYNNKSVLGRDGLRYASIEVLCDDLKQHTKEFDPGCLGKALKRLARRKLLCDRANAASNGSTAPPF